jgi:hypothetical protein
MSVSLEVRTKLLKLVSSLLLGTAVLALAAHAAVPNASFNAPQSLEMPGGSAAVAVAIGDLNGADSGEGNRSFRSDVDQD